MSLLLISRHRRPILAATAVGAAAVLALAGPVTAAFSDASGTPVVHTSETVKADLDASGKVDVARLFSQIEASGKGHVLLVDPTSTDGLRNLDGWGAPSTKGDNATYNFSVDGTKSFRTVANYDKKKLPVTVSATYTLDGKQIKPDDLAGKSGKLAVTYTIKNTTAEPTDISYPDGHGKTVTETVDIVTPYVGQLALDLPSSFDAIKSIDDRADQAGDGHGGRLVNWTMVLFEPIGQNTQTLGFTAQVTDAVLPEASIQLVPVSPENHPELKFGQDGFSSGAKSGQDLTAGATQIDDNVLKLRDGAAKLLDGLTQLQSGANDLSTGLSSGVPAAIDGGKKLAKGAQDAAAGAGQIQSGSSQLAAGATKLSNGFNDPNSDNDLIDGSQALASGLGLINAGVKDLPSSIKTNPGYQQLKGALAAIGVAIGSKGDSFVNGGKVDPKTLNAAINAIEFGLTNPGCNRADPLNAANPCGFKEALNTLQTQLSTPGSGPTLDPLASNAVALAGQLGAAGGKEALEYIAGPKVLNCGVIGPLGLPSCSRVSRAVFPSANPSTEPEVVNNVLAGVIAKLGDANTVTTAVGALAALQQKINAASGGAPAPGTLFFGLEGVRRGLTNPSCSPADPANAANPCGLKEVSGLVSAGIDQLVSGISTSLGSVISPANIGAADLADGIATAADGADQLSAGAAQLSHGSAQLAAGLKNKLAPGAAQLSDGLQDLNAAKDGAALIADGTGQASAGTQQIVDGAGQLSAEGTSQLVSVGNDTAKSYGKEYATMQALNQKGKDNAMPVGAPKQSADNRGAFDITLAGVGHEGAGSASRGVAAIVILAIGAAATTLLRGRFGS